MEQNNNDLQPYRLKGRFTILQVMAVLALLGIASTFLLKILFVS